MSAEDRARARLARLQRDGLRPDGHWNRRVVRYAAGGYGIHEVHYQPDGTVWAYATDPSEAVHGDLDELLDSIEFTYATSLDALLKPVLEQGELPKGSH